MSDQFFWSNRVGDVVESLRSIKGELSALWWLLLFFMIWTAFNQIFRNIQLGRIATALEKK